MAQKNYIVDINLNKNQLLNAVLQNLSVPPSTTGLPVGFTYYHTVDQTVYTWVGDQWIDLGFTYVAPVYTPINVTFTGTTVLSTFTTDDQGNVTSLTTRDLTLSNFGINATANEINASSDLSSVVSPAAGWVYRFTNTSNAAWGQLKTSELNNDLNWVHINDSATNLTETWSSSKIQDVIDELASTFTGGLVFEGEYNASTNTPNLTSPSPGVIKKGYTWVVSVDGTFFGEDVAMGDTLISKVDDPSTIDDWVRVNKNIPSIVNASQTVFGITRYATSSEALALTATDLAISPATLQVVLNNVVGGYTALFGDGSSTTFEIVHNLNTKFVEVQVYEESSGNKWEMGITISTSDRIIINTNIPPTTNQYRVIIKK